MLQNWQILVLSPTFAITNILLLYFPGFVMFIDYSSSLYFALDDLWVCVCCVLPLVGIIHCYISFTRSVLLSFNIYPIALLFCLSLSLSVIITLGGWSYCCHCHLVMPHLCVGVNFSLAPKMTFEKGWFYCEPWFDVFTSIHTHISRYNLLGNHIFQVFLIWLTLTLLILSNWNCLLSIIQEYIQQPN